MPLHLFSLTSIAKAGLDGPGGKAIQVGPSSWLVTDQVHELPDQTRNEKDVACHGSNGVQLLLRKCQVFTISFISLFSHRIASLGRLHVLGGHGQAKDAQAVGLGRRHKNR